MSYRRDHTFVNARPQHATIGYEGIVMAFNVLAEPENMRTVAHVCFASYLFGPGEKVYLGRGKKGPPRGGPSH